MARSRKTAKKPKLREGTPGNSPLLTKGELRTKGPEVLRGVLTVLKPAEFRIDPRHSGRLALANWIAAKDNPLTALLVVNRVWQHLFGQALVATVDNFGSLATGSADNTVKIWKLDD
jgi:hypothetical protein